MYDIAIVGGGPAGATLARLVGDRYRVLLVDRRRPDAVAGQAGGQKCCGGLLAPDAQQMLSRFGLGLPKSVLVEPQLFVVRAVDIPQRLERYYQRYYINMDRGAFDRWLLALLPNGVELRPGCRLEGYSAAADCVELHLAAGGKTVTERARLLVGADGAASVVRRSMPGAAAQGPAYVAIQEWVECPSTPPYFSAIFDPAITDYYCWTIPKGDRLLVGAALGPQHGAGERFAALKEKLAGLGFRLGRTVWREGGLLRRPRSMAQLGSAEGRVALVGEAGGWISPSSAEGLSYAMRTALALAEALGPGLDGCGPRYRRTLRGLAWNILLKNLKARWIFQPLLRRLALQSGLNSLAVYRPAGG
ncbi:MAG: FAD-binding protein [Thermoguttaceae bacterium]|jgi:flavin-dependent dehydrogenase